MKNLICITLLLLLMVSGCEENEGNQPLNLDEIVELEKEIIALSESVSCTTSSEWKFTPMGSKACGGPMKYIAYHQSVEVDFLKLVDQYTFQQDQYNKRNNVGSDCALVLAPKSVTCEGGKAFLIN